MDTNGTRLRLISSSKFSGRAEVAQLLQGRFSSRAPLAPSAAR
jgi:hypothetical protein